MAAGNVSIDEQGLRREKVRQMLRINVRRVDAFKRELHIGEHGTLNAGRKMLHLAADFIVVSDVSKCSAPELRDLSSDKKIGLAANRNRIQTGVPQIPMKRSEDFFFIPKIAISKKN